MNLEISLSDVQSVYSGKPGCCCGCRGKHTYASAQRVEASKARGYEVTSDEVSDRVVKQHVKKIIALAASGEATISTTPVYVCATLPERIYIAYFRR